MGVAEVRDRIGSCTSGRLVVTGGEPLLQRRELESLFAELPPNLFVEVETNGTLVPGEGLVARVDHWNVSPKLENSGEAADRRLKLDVLVSFRDTGRAFLKLVVDADTDAEEVTSLVRQLDWPYDKVLLMPQAATRVDLLEKAPRIDALAARLGVRASPRLHVLRWDGKRGT
jgi:organic radical activating enzyme